MFSLFMVEDVVSKESIFSFLVKKRYYTSIPTRNAVIVLVLAVLSIYSVHTTSSTVLHARVRSNLIYKEILHQME